MASGSSVPAWPAFCASNSAYGADGLCRRQPCGLSSTSQPCTGFPFLRRVIGTLRLRVPAPSGQKALGRSRSNPCPRPGGPWARKQRVDAARLLEGLIAAEADIGRELQVHRVRNLAADEALVAVHRLDHRRGVRVAQRDHVGSGELQIGRQANLRYGHNVGGDNVVVDVAAREHLGELVTDQFADAQLALRRRLGRLRFLSGHIPNPTGIEPARGA